MISPEMNGRIEKIHVSRGQRVKKGHLLVSLNTDAIKKQIQGTKSGLELATTTYEKQKALWDQGIGSEIQYLSAKNSKETLEAQLETLEAQVRMAQIRAPFDGIVDKIFPKQGEMAGPAMPVIEFVSLGALTIKADVSEAYIDQVRAGQNVELTFSSLPDYSLKTPVVRVSKVINSVSRTFEIELHVKNASEKIKPNMVSTIKINVFSADRAYVVPSLAIRKDITGKYVYVTTEKEGEQVVEKRAVETSLSYEDETMITAGLNTNDKVIVKGYHLVSAGMPVHIVE
jgi:membrane fusion protein (multidrug efflux system)